ncbi:Ion channel [Azotobacter vinelandii]|nr:Ion channel [Azotobacter vinelandii]
MSAGPDSPGRPLYTAFCRFFLSADAPTAMPPLFQHFIRLPSAGLLSIQLLGVLLYPLMEDTRIGPVLFGAFGIIVLGAALRMVRRSAAVTWVALVLAGAILVLMLANTLVFAQELRLSLALLESAFYLYAAGSLIHYMMEDPRATTDELFAAGATFTLLAWAFAYLFVACQLVAPGSFVGQLNPEAPRSWMDLLFLSFTTLSGVGIGDILPLRPFARALVMLEEFVGVMYFTLVVSRLIGLTVLGAKR